MWGGEDFLWKALCYILFILLKVDFLFKYNTFWSWFLSSSLLTPTLPPSHATPCLLSLSLTLLHFNKQPKIHTWECPHEGILKAMHRISALFSSQLKALSHLISQVAHTKATSISFNYMHALSEAILKLWLKATISHSLACIGCSPVISVLTCAQLLEKGDLNEIFKT